MEKYTIESISKFGHCCFTSSFFMKEPILVRHPLLISLTCEHSKNSAAFFINSHGYLELNRSTSDKFETCRGERKKDEKPLLGKLNLRLVRKLLHY